jgi:hypothetical protein
MGSLNPAHTATSRSRAWTPGCRWPTSHGRSFSAPRPIAGPSQPRRFADRRGPRRRRDRIPCPVPSDAGPVCEPARGLRGRTTPPIDDWAPGPLPLTAYRIVATDWGGSAAERRLLPELCGDLSPEEGLPAGPRPAEPGGAVGADGRAHPARGNDDRRVEQTSSRSTGPRYSAPGSAPGPAGATRPPGAAAERAPPPRPRARGP